MKVVKVVTHCTVSVLCGVIMLYTSEDVDLVVKLYEWL